MPRGRRLIPSKSSFLIFNLEDKVDFKRAGMIGTIFGK
jgi:hypothetical protein